MQNRFKKLKNISENIDGILLFNRIPENLRNPNFFYFTNCDVQGIFYHDLKKATIFTNAMEKPRARSWIKNIQIIKTLDDFLQAVDGRIGIDKQNTSAAVADSLSKNKIKTVNISNVLEDMRSIKSPQEIKIIRKATNLTGNVYEKICSEDVFSFTECELRGLIDYQINRMGAEPAFPTIVASGRNIAIPHHHPTIQKISKTLLMDFGLNYNGYCTDVSRTFNSRYEKKINEILKVLEKRMKPRIKASELDKLSRKLLGRDSKNFITSLGHGLGVSVHEKPHLTSNSKDTLQEGMVIAVEPAIYIKNGIRIENDYLITEDGCENLTDF